NRMGGMLLDLGAWNVTAMVFMAWIFGWLAGAGLPPTATYIIGAVVIVRPLQELGINPWVAHFFVFLLSVWGELSPPTSLTAAVSFVVMLHPSQTVALITAVAVVPFSLIGIWRHRVLASPALAATAEPAAAPAEDLDQLVAEAKREL